MTTSFRSSLRSRRIGDTSDGHTHSFWYHGLHSVYSYDDEYMKRCPHFDTETVSNNVYIAVVRTGGWAEFKNEICSDNMFRSNADMIAMPRQSDETTNGHRMQSADLFVRRIQMGSCVLSVIRSLTYSFSTSPPSIHPTNPTHLFRQCPLGLIIHYIRTSHPS